MDITIKTCSDCKVAKEVSEFDSRSDRKCCFRSYCKVCRVFRTKAYDESNKQKIKLKRAEYYAANKKKISEQNKAFREGVKAKHGLSYNSVRKRNDINFKIRSNLRKRLYDKIKLNSSSVECGCTIEQLRMHIEGKFSPDMSWDNWGKVWELDHIKPLALFDLSKKSEFREACNYMNLQPLHKNLNRKKGKKYVF